MKGRMTTAIAMAPVNAAKKKSGSISLMSPDSRAARIGGKRIS